MVAERAIRVVSLTDAAADGRLRTLVREVATSNAELAIEDEGAVAAVLVPRTDYDELLAYRAAKRREEAAARLRVLRQEVLARNTDLTPEEADALAERAVREVEEDMAREGKLRLRRGR